MPKRPIGTAPDDDAGVGIYVEADSSVTGNVIENAPSFGIVAGWGKYLRDVAITGNVIRNAFVGVGVSVVPGAGTALVNSNMISETPRGAVVGLDHARAITTDLVGRRRAALRAAGGRPQRGAALVLSVGWDALAQQRVALRHRNANARCAAADSVPASRRDQAPAAGISSTAGRRPRQALQRNRRARPPARPAHRHRGRAFGGCRRRLRCRLRLGPVSAISPAARRARRRARTCRSELSARSLAGQQTAPGFDGSFGFLDVFEKVGFAVIAAPASGFEQFGEMFQPLFGKSAPARDDVAATCDVGSICHQKCPYGEKRTQTQPNRINLM